MEELIYNIVSEIVEHKDEIKIEKFVKNAREHYILTVHPDDCGRVIGKKGTGKGTSQSALDFGVPLPLITESVFARYISAL